MVKKYTNAAVSRAPRPGGARSVLGEGDAVATPLEFPHGVGGQLS